MRIFYLLAIACMLQACANHQGKVESDEIDLTIGETGTVYLMLNGKKIPVNRGSYNVNGEISGDFYFSVKEKLGLWDLPEHKGGDYKIRHLNPKIECTALDNANTRHCSVKMLTKCIGGAYQRISREKDPKYDRVPCRGYGEPVYTEVVNKKLRLSNLQMLSYKYISDENAVLVYSSDELLFNVPIDALLKIKEVSYPPRYGSQKHEPELVAGVRNSWDLGDFLTCKHSSLANNSHSMECTAFRRVATNNGRGRPVDKVFSRGFIAVDRHILEAALTVKKKTYDFDRWPHLKPHSKKVPKAAQGLQISNYGLLLQEAWRK